MSLLRRGGEGEEMNGRRYLAIVATLTACSSPITEAVVYVDADPGLRRGDHRLCMRVANPATGDLDIEKCRDTTAFEWPAALPVHLTGSSDREEFDFEAELFDGSVRLAVARGRVRFDPGHRRSLSLLLTTECGVSCADDTTCIGGVCEPSCFDLRSLGREAPSRPTPCAVLSDAGAGRRDASSDAEPGAPLDGG